MMTVDEKLSRKLHSSLPISKDEQIIAVFRHHWFVYAVIILGAIAGIIVVWITAFMLNANLSGQDAVGTAQNGDVIFAGASLVTLFIAVGSLIPLMMRAGEHLVVTDEAIFQVLQPSVFNSKISQLSLAHVNDVSVRRDFFGTILGYGTITIETPGEQANYHFRAAEEPDVAAKEIVEAHENFQAALESGRVATKYKIEADPDHTVNVDAAQYQEFLNYLQFKAEAAKEAGVATAAAAQTSPTQTQPTQTQQQR